MDVSMYQRRLAEAELYAAEGIELIQRQRAAIQVLKRDGCDTSLAIKQLDRMRGAHAAIEEHRATLMASIAV
jgi:hypothetical protein